MIANAPIKANRSMVETKEVVREVAGKLFDEKWNATQLGDENGRKDVMSLLGEWIGSVLLSETSLMRHSAIERIGGGEISFNEDGGYRSDGVSTTYLTSYLIGLSYRILGRLCLQATVTLATMVKIHPFSDEYFQKRLRIRSLGLFGS
jgi:hypothetical protein